MSALVAPADVLERRWQDAGPVLDTLLDQPDAEREQWLTSQQLDAELVALLQQLLARARTPNLLDRGPLALVLPVDEDALWQRRLGAWQVLRPLGAGGAASVFLGERADGAFEQRVAIKILRSGVLDPIERERFALERHTLARLQHPGIARLIDGGISPEGAPYLVLEFVDGAPIDVWCDRQRLDLHARLRLFLEVCSAVQFAHQHLIVHRDLKPSNIFVGADGRVRLLDFGIAKLLDDSEVVTRTEARRLTPAYAAPEQIRGGPISTAIDVYALGVLLHELLIGARPIWQTTGLALPLVQHAARVDAAALASRQMVSTQQLARQLRGDLQAIVDTTLKAEPAQRYASVTALAEDVAHHLAGLAVRVRGDARWYRATRWLRRHALATTAATALLLTLLAAALFSARQAQLAQLQSRRAQTVQAFLVELLQTGAIDGDRTAPTSVAELMRIGAERARTAFPESPQTRAELLTMLGRLLHQQGQHQAADRTLRAAQTVEHEQLGMGVSGSLSTRLALAVLHAERQPTAAAFDELERILAEQKAARSAKFEIAENLQMLGYMHSRAGRHAQALPLLREAVALTDASARHGGALLALGDAQARAGDDPAAMRSFAAALRATPAQSIEYSRVQRSIGYALQRVNDWSGAQTALEESLRLQNNLLPKDHPHTAQTLIALGSLSFERGQFQRSHDYFERAFQMRERLFGANGVEIAEPLVGMGTVAATLGDQAEAVRRLSDALSRVESLPLEQEHHRGWVLGNLSAALRKNGDPAQALIMAERAHAIFLRDFGASSDKTLSAVVSMERARQALGQGDKALVNLQHTRAQLQDAALAAPIDLLSGHISLDLGRWQAARAAFDKVLAEAKTPMLRADAYIGLADVAAASSDPVQARQHLSAARDLLKQRLPAEHPRLSALDQRLRL